MANYYPYRVLLITETNLFTESIDKKGKASILSQTITEIEKTGKVKFQSHGKTFVVYLIEKRPDSIYFLELAREDRIALPQEGEKRTVKKETTVFPSIYFIINLDYQIILIQSKLSVFSSRETSVNRITDFFDGQLKREFTQTKLEPISYAEDFWNELDTAKEIFSISLDINPPNYFSGIFESDIDVKKVHDKTNFNKLRIEFTNKFGHLSITKQVFDEAFQFLLSGAGAIVAAIKDKMGKRTKIDSKSKNRRIVFPDNIEEIDQKVLVDEFNRLEQMNQKDKQS